MSVIDDIQAQLDDHETRIGTVEDNGYADTPVQDLNDLIQQLSDQLTADEQNIGQLTLPPSQDTIDIVNEITTNFFTTPLIASTQTLVANLIASLGGSGVLVGGTVTIANSLITANSLVVMSVSKKGGTQGILSYAVTAGSLVITSTSNTDTSTVVYLIIQP